MMSLLKRIVPSPIAENGKRETVLLLSLLILACGATTVTIRVDIMSFLSQDEMLIAYGTTPPIPGNGPEISIQTPVETIPLPDEIQTITEIEAIEILAVVNFRNDTGTATLTYKIYFDSSAENIFNTLPVLDQQVDLTPGSNLRHEILIVGDQRLLSLFEKDEIAMASEIEVVPGGGPENISGTVELSELTVQIMAVGETQ